MKKINKVRITNAIIFSVIYLLGMCAMFFNHNHTFARGKFIGTLVTIFVVVLGIFIWVAIMTYKKTHSYREAAGVFKKGLIKIISVRWWLVDLLTKTKHNKNGVKTE